MTIPGTLCDLAGIKAPTTSEGISFKPVLEGTKDAVREALYGAYCGGGRPGTRCVKQGDWKLTEYQVDKTGARHTQLFNLKDNPQEFIKEHHEPGVIALTGIKPTHDQVNLADNPEYATKLKHMRALLLAEMRRHDDPYRLSTQPDDGLPTPIINEKLPRKPKRKKKLP
jgi:choline-sulfatase